MMNDQATGIFIPPDRCANCGAHLDADVMSGSAVATECPHCHDDLEQQARDGRKWNDVALKTWLGAS